MDRTSIKSRSITALTIVRRTPVQRRLFDVPINLHRFHSQSSISAPE
jgi:hypothetical protein